MIFIHQAQKSIAKTRPSFPSLFFFNIFPLGPGLRLKSKPKIFMNKPMQTSITPGPSTPNSSPSPNSHLSLNHQAYVPLHFWRRRRRRRNWIWEASPGALEAGPNCRCIAPRRRVVLLSPPSNTSSCSVLVTVRSWLLQPLQAREGRPLLADVDGDTHERGRPYPGGTPVGGVQRKEAGMRG